MTMRITLLFEPSADREIPFGAGLERYRPLAEEVGRYVGTRVEIVKNVLRNAPKDDFLLFAGSSNVSRSLADCGDLLAARLAPRIVLLDVSWQKALEQLEKYRFAGAVDSLSLSQWLARSWRASGPFGLRYLARPIAGSCVLVPTFRSVHYCLLESNHHSGMAHLLADYLAAYHHDKQLLSTLPSLPLARLPVAQLELSDEDSIAYSEERTVSGTILESVSVKRVIDSLRRARETSRMTLPQVAESSGVDAKELELLEGSDYLRAKLGTLRAYSAALEQTWGWTISDSHFHASHWGNLPDEREEIARQTDEPNVRFLARGQHGMVKLPKPPPLTSESPWLLQERGMTFMGNRPSHRRRAEGDFDRSATENPKEEPYASV